jgi:hypothetical protein
MADRNTKVKELSNMKEQIDRRCAGASGPYNRPGGAKAFLKRIGLWKPKR